MPPSHTFKMVHADREASADGSTGLVVGPKQMITAWTSRLTSVEAVHRFA